MPLPTNLTARAARWSAAHRRLAIGGWLAFVVATVIGGGAVGMVQGSDDGVRSSGRADRILHRAFPDRPTERVIVETRDRAVVADVAHRLRATTGVTAAQVTDRRPGATLIAVDLAREDDVDAVLATTRAAAHAHPGAYVGEYGETSVDNALSDQTGADMGRAETVSLPITLVLLVLTFGSLVAALVPLGLAMSAVLSALGLVQLVSHLTPMADTVNSVVLLIGLAVGVDYSLFYLRREREERAAGRGADAALQAAAATSGHAVLVSGLTVIVAMAGMLLAGSAIFTAIAIGAVMVVAVALIASVTVLPALLSWLGDRVEKGRVLRRRREGPGAWTAVVGRAARRPVASLVAGGAVLIALAVPALSMDTALPDMTSVSDSIPEKVAFDHIERAFPGGSEPATIAVRAADVTAPAVRSAIRALHPLDVEVSHDRGVAAVHVPVASGGTDPASERALHTLREQTIPATLGRVPGVRADVAGTTAGETDFADLMRDRAPVVFAFVLGLAFVLLAATFRSVVIPVKAIVLNLLSVAAAYGVLALAFPEPVTAWLPLFLFVILFGLSMDYHVFIVSRIRELRLAGASTRDAVAEGIRTTASTVTSAAAIMVAVFAAFAFTSSLEMRQMGIGLAAAVLIDATLIRAVLLPAAMTLLGEANWWWPRRRVAAPRAAASRAGA